MERNYISQPALDSSLKCLSIRLSFSLAIITVFSPASLCVSLSRRFKANLPLVVTINAEKGSLKLQLIVSV